MNFTHGWDVWHDEPGLMVRVRAGVCPPRVVQDGLADRDGLHLKVGTGDVRHLVAKKSRIKI